MVTDYGALLILYVDSDADSLLAFRDAVSDTFAVTTAHTGGDALRLLRETDVALLLVERQLSDMSGIELLRRARELRPTAARVLTATELDVTTALAAINVGHVGGYLAKPWSDEQLRAWLRTALDALLVESTIQSMQMRLWHGGQVAAATTIYEELVHELSNPLGALEINASLVADQLQTLAFDPGTPEMLAQAIESAREAQADAIAAIDQIKGLVTRMRHGRALDRTRSPLRNRCKVVRAVDATVRVVRTEIEKVASLEVDLAHAPPAAKIDASALGQVLLNLLLNAAQALPAVRRASNRVRISAREQAGQLELSVEDNGAGIPAEHLERVFEPFFTTKESGTGLGLAICRELITQCYGTIRVYAVPTGGTRFVVHVPLANTD
jgi:signal transduction histidine kinase